MCGLAGYWAPEPGPVDASSMGRALVHRGPDDGGTWSDAPAGIALAHRRLAILDLSAAGHQPMHSPGGRYVMAYNGEVYNHLEIRAELERAERAERVAWRGHSDTETLIVAIERWGLAGTLERAVGMFALAVWDRQTSSLSLARDRMGEKPLYYGWSSGGGIVFGSELKALKAAPGFANPISDAALELYFRFNYVPAPLSILADIYKIEPGSIVTIEQNARVTPPLAPPSLNAAPTGGVTCLSYWSLPDVIARGTDDAMTDTTVIERTEQVLSDAIAMQNVADVPVGAFLSGGIDSSTIVALLSKRAPGKVNTFTIGFDDAGFDEAPYARAIAAHLGTDHTELYVAPDDVQSLIPDLPIAYDEPFADSSQLPTMLLAKLARTKVTVALSGDAGDELFGGYNRYLAATKYHRIATLLPASLSTASGRALTGVPVDRWDQVARLPFVPKVAMAGRKVHKLGRMLRAGSEPRALYRAATDQWADGVPVLSRAAGGAAVDAVAPVREPVAEQMMQWDMVSYLPDDILCKVDRAAMAASLETRVPFLDHRVVEHAWRLPLRFKIRGGQGKWVIRQILNSHVPKALFERPKAGFAIPIGTWLRGPLRQWADVLLSEQALQRHPNLDATQIRTLWHQHLSCSYDWTTELWAVIVFQLWLLEWSRRPPE